ncbi:MAG: hypothetical protein KF795_09535 [Labilithrix sp.]|nr:hypothetical protein [Labilithrix sp.]
MRSIAEHARAAAGGPVATLDALRARTLRLVAPLAPRLLGDRERRVVAYGLVAIAAAFALTVAAPMALLMVGPLVLGVPHLAADVRYLVARPGLHRRAGFWLFVAAPACLSFLHPHAWVSMSAIAGAALVARAPRGHRLVVALAGALMVAACFRLGRVADVALAHAHNAIAVALFALWSRRRSRLHGLVVLGFVLGVVAIGLGALDSRLVLDGAPGSRLFGIDLPAADALVGALAPLGDPVMAVRAVLAFAFAQSVHYAVWVRLVPEDDRPRPGLRSFASSLRALVADLGRPVVAATGVVGVGLAAWACFELAAARDGYLRLAVFHGPLELGAATLLLLEGRGRIRGGKQLPIGTAAGS